MTEASRQKMWNTTVILACAVLTGFGSAGTAGATQNEWAEVFRELESRDVKVRRKAATALVDIAYETSLNLRTQAQKEAVRKRIRDMAAIVCNKDEDSEVRGNLVKSIGFFGSRAAHAVPLLIPVLLDEKDHEHVRSWIAMTLPEIGPPEKVAPAILAASRSSNKNVRINASMNLGNLKIDSNTLLSWANKAINDQTPQMRMGAITVAAQLAKQSKDKRAVPIILRGVNDSDKMVQIVALQLLSIVVPDSKDAKSALVNSLKSSDPEVRIRAAVALIMISKDRGQPDLSIPVRGLDSKDAAVRAIAAQALGACGAKAKEAVPALTRRLDDEEDKVRVQAAFSLSKITGKPEKYIAILVQALASKDSETRMLALGYLALMPPQAKKAAQPLLLNATKHKDSWVRGVAITLLPGFGLKNEKAVQVFSSALRDDDPAVRTDALEALGRMGVKAKSALPKVIQAKDDPVEDVRKVARRVELKITTQK